MTLSQYHCFNCDLKFYDPPLPGDGAFYAEMERRFSWYYEKDKWEFDTAVTLLNQMDGATAVLDVGCGRGHFLRRIQSLYRAEGIELNEQAVRECQSEGLQVSNSPLSSLEETYDLVTAFEVLEHLSSPREFISDALRALKPGGYLLIAVPNPDSYLSKLDRVLLDMPPHHVLSISGTTFEHMTEVFPLELVGIHLEPLRYSHYRTYVNNFLDPASGPAPSLRFMDRLLERALGRYLARTANTVAERLTNVHIATSYHTAKADLIGQTHLALFRKK